MIVGKMPQLSLAQLTSRHWFLQQQLFTWQHVRLCWVRPLCMDLSLAGELAGRIAMALWRAMGVEGAAAVREGGQGS